MKALRLAIITALLSALPAVYAASVELTNGRVYSYTLVSEDTSSYTMLIDGMRVQIPKSMVAAFSEEPTAPATKPGAVEQLRPGPDSPPVMRGEAFPAQIPPGEEPLSVTAEPAPPLAAVPNVPEVRLPLPASGPESDQLQANINALSLDTADSQRADAREALQAAGDPGLSMLVTYGLYNDVPSVRTAAVNLLANSGGQRVLKQLIEAFYAAATPTIAPYQVAYVNALARQISRLTGKDFSLEARRTGRAPALAEEMIAWWNDNFDRLPPQLGEPKLDPTDPEYFAQLRTVRALTLSRRQFAGTSYPETVTVAPAVPSAPAEEEFAKSFQTVPRDLGVSQVMPFAGQPPVIKEPSPARDAPGAFRDQQMQERMLNEERRLRGYWP